MGQSNVICGNRSVVVAHPYPLCRSYLAQFCERELGEKRSVNITGTALDAVSKLYLNDKVERVILFPGTADKKNLQLVKKLLNKHGVELFEVDNFISLSALKDIVLGVGPSVSESLVRAEGIAHPYTRKNALRKLTPSQRLVFMGVANGKNNLELATALGVSVNTVKVHLHGIFKRLGIQSRTQIACFAAY
ncbi:MAG: helix-turn-helix transcriptional regulator [Halopseudomonas sp.]